MVLCGTKNGKYLENAAWARTKRSPGARVPACRAMASHDWPIPDAMKGPQAPGLIWITFQPDMLRQGRDAGGLGGWGVERHLLLWYCIPYCMVWYRASAGDENTVPYSGLWYVLHSTCVSCLESPRLIVAGRSISGGWKRRQSGLRSEGCRWARTSVMRIASVSPTKYSTEGPQCSTVASPGQAAVAFVRRDLRR